MVVKAPTQQNGRLAPPSPLVPHLKAIDIFRELTEDEIAVIHEAVTSERRHKGALLYTPGDPGDRLFVLKQGSVSLYRVTLDGHKLVVRTLGAGTIFGEMELTGQSMRGCFAEADEDVLVCTLARSALERLIAARPVVALRLLTVMGQRVQELEERLESMAYGSARQRLARFLLVHAKSGLEGRSSLTGFSHEDIAEAIGSIRQTVTSELQRMKDEGLIGLHRKCIDLLDQLALHAAAEGARD